MHFDWLYKFCYINFVCFWIRVLPVFGGMHAQGQQSKRLSCHEATQPWMCGSVSDRGRWRNSEHGNRHMVVSPLVSICWLCEGAMPICYRMGGQCQDPSCSNSDWAIFHFVGSSRRYRWKVAGPVVLMWCMMSCGDEWRVRVKSRNLVP